MIELKPYMGMEKLKRINSSSVYVLCEYGKETVFVKNIPVLVITYNFTDNRLIELRYYETVKRNIKGLKYFCKNYKTDILSKETIEKIEKDIKEIIRLN